MLAREDFTVLTTARSPSTSRSAAPPQAEETLRQIRRPRPGEHLGDPEARAQPRRHRTDRLAWDEAVAASSATSTSAAQRRARRPDRSRRHPSGPGAGPEQPAQGRGDPREAARRSCPTGSTFTTSSRSGSPAAITRGLAPHAATGRGPRTRPRSLTRSSSTPASCSASKGAPRGRAGAARPARNKSRPRRPPGRRGSLCSGFLAAGARGRGGGEPPGEGERGARHGS